MCLFTVYIEYCVNILYLDHFVQLGLSSYTEWMFTWTIATWFWMFIENRCILFEGGVVHPQLFVLWMPSNSIIFLSQASFWCSADSTDCTTWVKIIVSLIFIKFFFLLLQTIQKETLEKPTPDHIQSIDAIHLVLCHYQWYFIITFANKCIQ